MSLELERRGTRVATKIGFPPKLQEGCFVEHMWPGAGGGERGGWIDGTSR